MIRSNRNFRTALVLAAGLFVAGSASASTVTECLDDVTITRNAITGAKTFLNANDQNNLAGKADGASQKINKGKFSDASTVLNDMSAKISSLVNAAKPKLGADEGAVISADIATASACVTGLMTQ
jgi:hypothetical protein